MLRWCSIRALPLLLLALAMPAMAQGPSRAAARAGEGSRAAEAQARRDAEQEARLTAERIATAQAVQAADALYDSALERQRRAMQAAQAAEAEVRARTAAFTAMLPVMRRLALYPAETLLALPAPPEEALRGTLVLRSLARHLRDEADALRLAREAAAETAARAEVETARLSVARDIAREAAATLDIQLALLRGRQAVLREAGREAALRDAERAQAAAARAASLPEMIARLPSAPPRAETVGLVPPPPPPAPATGPAGLPVAGRVTRDFGAPGEAGPARGLTIAAPPGARVVAPCAGRVAFAGVFRSYGQLLILECGEGIHLVLSGFARLDATGGDRVSPGEPVGILGDAGPGGRATLYLELRRQGLVSDPRPWLAARS